MLPAAVALWLQTVSSNPTPSLEAPHVIEAIGLALAIGLAKVWDARVAHPKIRKERNEELDLRLTSLRTAIDIGHQSIRQDVNGLSTDVRDLRAHVIGPDGQNGLRGEVRDIKRELALLAPRKRKR